MALTITTNKVYSIGDRKEVIATITFDSSYPTGGESLTASDLGLALQVDYVESGAVARNGTNAVVTVYDYTNSKLMAFQSTTGAPNKLIEVANTSDLSSYAVRLRVVGKGKAAA